MKAACRFFGKCSGCTLQQFPYVKQLADKSRLIRTQFQTLAPKGRDPASIFHDIVPSPEPFGYRISSKLCLHEDEFGRKAIGLYQQNSKTVLDIPDCPVHNPSIDKLVQRLFRGKISPPAPFYNHLKKPFQPARLKFLTIRCNPSTQSFAIVVSHTGVERSVLLEWAHKFSQLSMSVYECILGQEDKDLILSRKVQHLSGPSTIGFDWEGHHFELNPLSFFQANFSLAPAFIQHITAGLAGETLLDLYGGFGTYSLATAAKFKRIILVEANEHSVELAKLAAKQAGFAHLSGVSATVEEYMKTHLRPEDRASISHMIINPPRAGLSSKALQYLIEGQWPELKTIHYVSCNRDTLKRDLQQLIQKGNFCLESLTPFDMFPQTEHIELVAKLSRIKGKSAPKVSAKPSFASQQTKSFGKIGKGKPSRNRPEKRRRPN